MTNVSWNALRNNCHWILPCCAFKTKKQHPLLNGIIQKALKWCGYKLVSVFNILRKTTFASLFLLAKNMHILHPKILHWITVWWGALLKQWWEFSRKKLKYISSKSIINFVKVFFFFFFGFIVRLECKMFVLDVLKKIGCRTETKHNSEKKSYKQFFS